MTINAPIALITGAGKRIGRHLATGLAARGWDIAATYNTSADEIASLGELIKEKERRLHAIRADLRDMKATEAILPGCCKTLGPPSLLINNASLFEKDELISLTSQSLEDHLAINLKAPLLLASHFARNCSGKGNIINITDQRVSRPKPGFYSYTISKMALADATRTMARALAPDIRVNAIAPGPVLQSIHQRASEFQSECEGTLLGHGAELDDIMRAVEFLLETPAITGETIHLDAGQHLI